MAKGEDLGKDPHIKRIREHIDRIDTVILTTLAERIALMPVFAKAKREKNLPIDDDKRDVEQITRFRELAEENGLDPGFVEEIFLTIIDQSKKVETEHFKRKDILQDKRY